MIEKREEEREVRAILANASIYVLPSMAHVLYLAALSTCAMALTHVVARAVHVQP